MNAIVWPHRIDILDVALPNEAWEPLLDELRAEHLPHFTPPGKRLFVSAGPGGVDAFVYRTQPVADDEVVRILGKHGIDARLGASSRT